MREGDNFFHLGKCDGFAFEPKPGEAEKLTAAYASAIKQSNVTIKATLHELDEYEWIKLTYPRRYG